MDLKYLTKEGSWEKNPPDLQAEVLQGKRGRLLVTIYRAGGAGLHPTVLLSHGFPGIEKNFDLAGAAAHRLSCGAVSLQRQLGQ